MPDMFFVRITKNMSGSENIAIPALPRKFPAPLRAKKTLLSIMTCHAGALYRQ